MNGDNGARRSDADTETHASPRPAASAQELNDSDKMARVPRDSDHSARELRDSVGEARGDQSSLTERGYGRLSKFLIGKSVAETILLVALVTVFSYMHFNPRLRGALDVANEREVSGWVFDESDPARRVEVELYIDDHFVARRRADAERPDVLAAGRAADAAHGFVFETPPLPSRAAPYEARVFAAHEGPDRDRIGLQKIGKSLWLDVRPSERSAGVPEKWWEGLEKR